VLGRDAGEEVAAVQMDLTFDADTLAIAADPDGRPDCSVDPAIDKPASGFGFGPSGCGPGHRPCSRVRAVIVATDNVDPIDQGAVLYRCRVAVDFDAPMGRQVIRSRRALYSDSTGRERTAVATDASITVSGAPLDTPTPAPTSTPRDTPTRAGSGSGGGCDLHSGDSAPPGLFWPALVAGLMWLMSRLRKERGAPLWSWAIAVPLLTITSPVSAVVSIDIGSATGIPGDSVAVSVRLTADEGEEVAGTQNDLRFDPAVAAVAALEDGTPDCAVNLDINKLATAFGFRPSRCDPMLRECTAVRAIVLAFDNVDPIADGSLLYTCRFGIAADAASGEYELANTRTGYAPPAGGDLPAAGRGGVLAVGAASTATPRPSDTPAPTATMATPGPTTPVIHDPGDTNCDGALDRDDLRAVVASIFTRAETCNADCNRDGQVSGPDLVCVTYRHNLAARPKVGSVDRFGRSRQITARGRTR
jgi:hypothetical protein